MPMAEMVCCMMRILLGNLAIVARHGGAFVI